MSEDNQRDVTVRCGQRSLAGCWILLLVMLAGCGGLWWYAQRGWTVAKVERRIQAEVPPRCDRKAAQTWFARHGIRSDWFEGASSDMRGHQTLPQLAGLRDEDIGETLRGEIDGRDANVDLVCPGKINVYFFFDKQGHRVGHLVVPFVYAP